MCKALTKVILLNLLLEGLLMKKTIASQLSKRSHQNMIRNLTAKPSDDSLSRIYLKPKLELNDIEMELENRRPTNICDQIMDEESEM
jgi:hypothetical protein